MAFEKDVITSVLQLLEFDSNSNTNIIDPHYDSIILIVTEFGIEFRLELELVLLTTERQNETNTLVITKINNTAKTTKQNGDNNTKQRPRHVSSKACATYLSREVAQCDPVWLRN